MSKEDLYTVANTLYFIQKNRVSLQVRKSHLKKNKKTCTFTDEALIKLEKLEDWLNSELKERVKAHPAYFWFSKVKGVGDINIGKVIGMIDIEKAETVSKLWRFAGFKPGDRKIKGEMLHYNEALKSMCWRLAKSLIRAKGEYYEYYLEQKKRLRRVKEKDGLKIVPSAKLPKEKDQKTGKMKHVEKDGFYGLGHVDGTAQRKMIKLFLSHLWVKWRAAEGLAVTKPYAQSILGHENYRDPDSYIEQKAS